jgi:ribosomal protein S27E
MQISESNKQKIQTWFKEKAINMRCLCCGVIPNWNLPPFATFNVIVDLDTTRIFYGAGQPQISLVCTNCGNILNFNPSIIGIQPTTPVPEKEEINDENK